jgi:deuterolysin
MRLASPFSVFLVLARHVRGMPVKVDKTPSFDVTLSQVDNTRIKAVVTNNGHGDVTFVHLNFFRDRAPVKKVTIYQNGRFGC